MDSVKFYDMPLVKSSAEMAEQCCAEGLPAEVEAKAESRKQEILGERLLLKRIFGKATPLLHNADLAPHVEGYSGYMSVAHTRGYLCIVLSNKPVGVDVETYRQQVLNVRKGFLNKEELAWLHEGDLMAHCIAWTAKEAIFKTIGERALVSDYREEIVLEPFKTPAKGERLRHYGQFKDTRFILDSHPQENQILTLCCIE